MTEPNLTTKICKTCSSERPIEEYPVTEPRARYRHPECRQCRYERAKRNRMKRIAAASGDQPRTQHIPDDIGPEDRIIAGGHDFTWAFVEFRDIPGFPFYKVSSDGGVWGCQGSGAGAGRAGKRWKKLSPRRTAKNGYLQVTLCNGPVRRAEYVHTLVLEAFIGPRPSPTHEVRHWPDRDASNNRIYNLYWGTAKENATDKDAHGTQPRGSGHYRTDLTEDEVVEIRHLAEEGWSVGRLAEWFETTSGAIEGIVRRQSWTHV